MPISSLSLNLCLGYRPAVPALLESVRPTLSSCQSVTAAIAELVPENQYWRWKDMWSNSMRTAVFAAALMEYLSNRRLLSLAQASETLGSTWLSKKKLWQSYWYTICCSESRMEWQNDLASRRLPAQFDQFGERASQSHSPVVPQSS